MRFWFSRQFILHMKAVIWRALMAIGMKFHHFAYPKPPSPNFKIVVPSRLSPRGGQFNLVFYVPQSYLSAPEGFRFPVVINFHGGGFTLGTGTDDARWAASVLHNVDAVMVSVEYRLAPEYPFSTGVEDGTDAILYVASHAEELRIDPHRIALSGFSAGANFAFTVPLMLHDLQNDAGRRRILDGSNLKKHRNIMGHSLSRTTSGISKAGSSTNSLPRPASLRTQSSTASIMKLSNLEPTALEIDHKLPDLTLRALVSFYPPTDFRHTRDQKRATNPKPEFNLPPSLANLFDESYMPSSSIDVNDPYLSPAAAPSDLLKAAYPQEIVLYTCEYDMLNKEGVEFGERLSAQPIGKTLHGGLIKEVVHAFDKKPNPIEFPKAAERCYNEACAELNRIFGGRSSIEERAQLTHEVNVDRYRDDEELLGEGDHLIEDGNGKGKGQESTRQRLESHFMGTRTSVRTGDV